MKTKLEGGGGLVGGSQKNYFAASLRHTTAEQ